MKRLRAMLWPALLLALLVVLAWLQYRWTGQISVAERQRMQASLQSSVRRLTGDLEEELALVFRYFRVDGDEELESTLVDRWNRYRDEARFAGLVEALYVAEAHGGALAKLDDSGGLVPVDWPDALAEVREAMSRRRHLRERPRRGRRPGPFPLAAGETTASVLAIVVPIASRDARWSRHSVEGFTVVVLDIDTVREEILPELIERHLGADYDVAVVDHRGELVFATSTGKASIEHPDARSGLFTFPPPGPRLEGRPPPRERERRRVSDSGDSGERPGPPAWEIFVRHRAGSLEAAVDEARTRNLAVSFGILGLLAASIGLIAVSTRRATELNDRKMEFVAGVSHELRTPVAVLRSAGQNLADGSVSDPAQVKRYGALIESEGRRLENLVEQVLELAGIQSQRRFHRRQAVAVEALVAEAMRDCESLRKERDVPIETNLPSHDATVIGDPDALRRALANVIANAIKHGGEDNAIEVRVEPRGAMVAIEVSDRGPGITERERARIFEAFYRGRRAQDGRVPGSGLGLSLVENIAREHGGSVDVESVPGEGSRFTLTIPAATAGE